MTVPQLLALLAAGSGRAGSNAGSGRAGRSSTRTMRLRARHWKITDAFGRLQEVKGAGVVGEQPLLEPGQSFEYTSGTPLPTFGGVEVVSLRDAKKPGDTTLLIVCSGSMGNFNLEDFYGAGYFVSLFRRAVVTDMSEQMRGRF